MTRTFALGAFVASVLLALILIEGVPFVSYTERGFAAEGESDAAVNLSEREFTWRGEGTLGLYEVTYCDGTTGSVQSGTWESGATLQTDSVIASVRTWATGGEVVTTSRICSEEATSAAVPTGATGFDASACPPVELSIDGNSFSWTGCPHMQRYVANFCDGTSVGPVYGDWTDDVTIDLGKRIESVQACGSDCHKRVTQSCPPPTPQPVAPACPFIETASTTVVRFDEEKLYSNGTQDEAESKRYTVALSNGSYKVETASWDGYLGRESVSQPRESWVIELQDGTAITTSSPTSDLADNVIESFIRETVDPSLALSRDASAIVLRHAAYPDSSSYNSVVPICASFTKLPPTPPSGPSCSATVTPASMKRGGQATLTWSSTGAVSASFDQGIGTTTTSGSLNVSPANDTVYTGTFVDSSGASVTCSARVSISSGGGGGKCLNCDDDDDEEEEEEEEDRTPTFVLGKTISRNGTTITLDQIPYTGFEAGPVATAFFWLTVLAFSVYVGHLITSRRTVARMNGISGTRLASDADMEVMRRHDVESSIGTSTSNDATYSMSMMVQSGEKRSIEDRAHAENILLSPEALRIITNTMANQRVDEEVFLKELFGKAVAAYAREDGWILISQERAQSLLAQHGVTDPNTSMLADTSVGTAERDGSRQVYDESARLGQVQVARGTQEPVMVARTLERFDMDTALPAFLDHLNAKEQQKGFELLRQLLTKGVSVESFITALVRKLDDVYKHRLEGNHAPDQAIAAKTATWSNADFEAVLGILVECIDYSYSSNKIGTKVALTKLFARS